MIEFFSLKRRAFGFEGAVLWREGHIFDKIIFGKNNN